MKALKFIGEFAIVAGIFFALGAVGHMERGDCDVAQLINTAAIGMIISLIGFMAMGIAMLRGKR